MKALHTTTALIEAGTGAGLLLAPSFIVTLLLGSPLDTPASILLGRVAGAGLLAFGIACWLARDGNRSLVPAMLLYNILAAALLAFAGFQPNLTGLALWPAVALHVIMAVWCLLTFKQKIAARRS